MKSMNLRDAPGGVHHITLAFHSAHDLPDAHWKWDDDLLYLLASFLRHDVTRKKRKGRC